MVYVLRASIRVSEWLRLNRPIGLSGYGKSMIRHSKFYNRAPVVILF